MLVSSDSKSESESKNKITALLNLVFTDGNIETFTVDKFEFAELQKQLLLNLQKDSLSIGGLEKCELTASRIRKELQQRKNSKSVYWALFSISLAAFFVYSIYELITGIAPNSSGVVAMGGLIVLTATILNAIVSTTSSVFYDEKEEKFVRNKLGDMDIDEIIGKNRGEI
jgi:hypothetical protein